MRTSLERSVPVSRMVPPERSECGGENLPRRAPGRIARRPRRSAWAPAACRVRVCLCRRPRRASRLRVARRGCGSVAARSVGDCPFTPRADLERSANLPPGRPRPSALHTAPRTRGPPSKRLLWLAALDDGLCLARPLVGDNHWPVAVAQYQNGAYPRFAQHHLAVVH